MAAVAGVDLLSADCIGHGTLRDPWHLVRDRLTATELTRRRWMDNNGVEGTPDGVEGTPAMRVRGRARLDDWHLVLRQARPFIMQGQQLVQDSWHVPRGGNSSLGPTWEGRRSNEGGEEQ